LDSEKFQLAEEARNLVKCAVHMLELGIVNGKINQLPQILNASPCS
jgi:hypothetical protein